MVTKPTSAPSRLETAFLCSFCCGLDSQSTCFVFISLLALFFSDLGCSRLKPPPHAKSESSSNELRKEIKELNPTWDGLTEGSIVPVILDATGLSEGIRASRAITFQGTGGELIRLQVADSTFPTELQVWQGNGIDARCLASSLPTDNPCEVHLVLPKNAAYRCMVTTQHAKESGSCNLALDNLAKNQPPKPPSAGWESLYAVGGDPEERYALLVGIDHYPVGLQSLATCWGDVHLMRQVLIETFHFRPENILMISDEAATRDNIIAAFRRQLGRAGPRGTAFFYFSGHGTQIRDTCTVGPEDPEPDGLDEAIVVWGSGPNRVSISSTTSFASSSPT